MIPNDFLETIEDYLIEFDKKLFTVNKSIGKRQHTLLTKINDVYLILNSLYTIIAPSISCKQKQASKETKIKTMRILEMENIEKALIKFKGNRTKTAIALGLSIRTVRNKIHEFGWKNRNFNVDKSLDRLQLS